MTPETENELLSILAELAETVYKDLLPRKFLPTGLGDRLEDLSRRAKALAEAEDESPDG